MLDMAVQMPGNPLGAGRRVLVQGKRAEVRLHS
eukprot:COSAG04_NODE_14936_length_549_cov_1.164444_2_plen_32_part_01